MSIKDRLKSYLSYKNLSVRELERVCNISNGVLGRLTESTSPKTLRRIEENTDLNVDWLMTGKGSMLKPSQDADVIKLGRPVAGIDEEMAKVRFFHLTPTATFQEYCSGDDESEDFIKIARMPGDRLDDSSCVFEIRGESMAPQIQPKSRVLCREVSPTRWHTLRDCVIVIAYGDKFVIKRIVENCLDLENYLILESDNPEYSRSEKVQLADIRCIFKAERIISQQIF